MWFFGSGEGVAKGSEVHEGHNRERFGTTPRFRSKHILVEGFLFATTKKHNKKPLETKWDSKNTFCKVSEITPKFSRNYAPFRSRLNLRFQEISGTGERGVRNPKPFAGRCKPGDGEINHLQTQ